MSTTSINLLGTTTRVEVPVIGIKIGKYTLGVYSRKIGISDYYDINPQFLKSLTVKKINGTDNQYTLSLDYPITIADDPI